MFLNIFGTLLLLLVSLAMMYSLFRVIYYLVKIFRDPGNSIIKGWNPFNNIFFSENLTPESIAFRSHLYRWILVFAFSSVCGYLVNKLIFGA